ncbi:MAG: HEAT repeat domain-containing protein [Planctomycetota bacterium]
MSLHRLCFLLVAVLPLLPAGAQEAQTDDEEEGAEQAAGAQEERKCTCREGHASYQSLGSPMRPPGDPAWCPIARAGLTCKLWKPGREHGEGYRAANMRSFLLRHAAAWEIQCSLCARFKGRKKGVREEHAEAAEAALSQKKIGGKRIEVAMSPHYLCVMDIPSLKIITKGGGIRVAGRHELLHLYVQRAETARQEWVRVFGEPGARRSLMVLVWSEGTRMKFSEVNFGNPRTNLLYGGGSGRLVGGRASNGFALSGRDDDQLNFNSRHMIGHLCISTYHTSGIHGRHLPQWIFRGAAHWLSKLHPRGRDHAYFCSYEDVTVGGSTSRWHDKAKKIAARGSQRDPVERMFQASTAKQMNYTLHVRAWSWFDIFTREEREPFVRFIQALREAQEARVAAKAAFGQAPEYVDDRWRERVLKKRGKVAATKREQRKEVEVEEAGRRELRDIAREIDPRLLAGKIRGLERAQNVKTARLLVSLIDSRRSVRVREVIALVLNRTEDPEVLAYLRGTGYSKAGRIGKATLLRVFGETKHGAATPLLREALADSFWLTKANAARALAQLGDNESIPKLAQMAAGEPKPKVRMAAMDALAKFGKEAEQTLPLWERNLMHRAWQVKIATCDAFRAIGSTAAVETLIGRIDSEGGRVHDAIKRTLEALTGMAQDWNREQWRKWWEKAKGLENLREKMKEELEKRNEPTGDRRRDDRRYAKKKEPTYYGIKVYARAVGYVLDVSKSMEQGFRVSAAWEERLGRKYTATNRLGVCKEELAQAIRELDPRTRLNVVFFNDRVRIWKSLPVPAGSMGENAIGTIKAVNPSGQTNYYDALRAILGMQEEGSDWRSTFADTPDTLFFLTDGRPTDGDITRSDELLAWFGEQNRFARLRVHVIAMGRTGIDIEFLRKLAEDNDGTFLHLTGSH